MSTGKGPVETTFLSKFRGSDPALRLVYSSNEGDPLKQVIVGRADGTMVEAPESAVERDLPSNGVPLGTYRPLPEEGDPQEPGPAALHRLCRGS